LVEAGVAQVVAALQDPWPAVNGGGFERLRGARHRGLGWPRGGDAERSIAGFLTRQRLGRPVRHAEARSVDRRPDRVPSGESRWITGRGGPRRRAPRARVPT
jgi:diaminohydroxyphosphoribosylaminopyrimidine deaminase/5-amino-6-(5-phosphoribosylamino)uracil reductase